jgi:hypothetical protein
MRSIRVTYDNGNTITTNINGTEEEIKAYYIGKTFNLGDGENDDCHVAKGVEFLHAGITIDKLYVCHLTNDMASRTCGPYYYTVHHHGMAHTAFCTREHLDLWMRERGLALAQPIDNPADWSPILGEYRTNFVTEAKGMLSLAGHVTRRLSNGQYTLCVITTDSDGVKVENVANPNCKDRIIYDYAESRKMMG